MFYYAKNLLSYHASTHPYYLNFQFKSGEKSAKNAFKPFLISMKKKIVERRCSIFFDLKDLVTKIRCFK